MFGFVICALNKFPFRAKTSTLQQYGVRRRAVARLTVIYTITWNRKMTREKHTGLLNADIHPLTIVYQAMHAFSPSAIWLDRRRYQLHI